MGNTDKEWCGMYLFCPNAHFSAAGRANKKTYAAALEFFFAFCYNVIANRSLFKGEQKWI